MYVKFIIDFMCQYSTMKYKTKLKIPYVGYGRARRAFTRQPHVTSFRLIIHFVSFSKICFQFSSSCRYRRLQISQLDFFFIRGRHISHVT